MAARRIARGQLVEPDGLVSGVALGTLAGVIDDTMLEAMEKMDKAVEAMGLEKMVKMTL